jgi:hypothetical protein
VFAGNGDWPARSWLPAQRTWRLVQHLSLRFTMRLHILEILVNDDASHSGSRPDFVE